MSTQKMKAKQKVNVHVKVKSKSLPIEHKKALPVITVDTGRARDLSASVKSAHSPLSLKKMQSHIAGAEIALADSKDESQDPNPDVELARVPLAGSDSEQTNQSWRAVLRDKKTGRVLAYQG